MNNIFTRQFKILGRSKKIRILSDIIFLIILAIASYWFVQYSIKKFDLGPIILNTVSQIKNTNKEAKISAEPEKKCSNPIIKSYALYYTEFGDQIGIGPNPPIVGIPTNYWVFFEINNKENDLKNIRLSANLPNNVNLSGNKNIISGNFEYTEKEKQVLWAIDNLRKNEKSRIRFEITLTPNNNDLNKILSLVQNIQFTASDEFCKKEISENFQNIDTKLSYDKFGKNSGRVLSPESSL